MLDISKKPYLNKKNKDKILTDQILYGDDETLEEKKSKKEKYKKNKLNEGGI